MKNEPLIAFFEASEGPNLFGVDRRVAFGYFSAYFLLAQPG
jgi:hypothetical protein